MEQRNARFRATTGDCHAFGATPREALTSLMRLVPGDVSEPIVIWPYNRGDGFFSDAQQARLQELKNRTDKLSQTERKELEALIESAFDAAIARTQRIASASF